MPQTHDLPRLGPVQTGVRRAQHALDDLWSQAEIETRAYTGNIVALTEKKHLRRVAEALERLGGRYAGRQIIGVMDGDESVEVEASLIPVRSLYVERLVLNANTEQLQGAILPLLRPTTLNHVWWASSAPPGGALLAELAEIADQVIADALSLDLNPDRRYALADLGWARTNGWREVTAQLFDAPDAARRLSSLNRLKVTHAAGNSRPARLFAGWISSKLGWLDLSCVSIESDPDCERENGDLCSVELSGHDAFFALRSGPRFSVRAETRYGQVERKTEMTVLSPSLAEGLGLVMARPGRNENFLDSLAVARRLP
ncbi:glucose-6-phosphate dehydrogenase assembly protein OpcA [Deinococcus peraridilitoris]|uniref:Glucose-6-P dehydrogenase subunit n=1 Tax=Deinococcus peraridilitoris (strain DSM 19664 / LMG 22246 / CIP 109416 / KR-200) TaxID=937777 RepID=K9ZWC3_DEIPD|nr:glucose-6-phosphate dehydrogenase assembly protein OpcA [Deinococcus peraridilitoris]AFZ65876.1 glucose-6-P dehydrogenase subunit [Deinococcus peraridilitoris DSM 19664]